MANLYKGQRIRIIDYTIHWINGQTSPKWCVEPDRTFEVLETPKRLEDGSYRVVIGNHRKGNGPITRGVTGAIKVFG